jgi:hypothetical protein
MARVKIDGLPDVEPAPAFRPTLKWTLVTLGVWLAASLCTALFLQRAGWQRLVAGSLVECTLASAVLLLLVGWRPVQWALGALPRWQKLLLVLLAFLTLCAQEFKVRARTYPFVDWRMYGDRVETASVRLLQVEGLLRDGRRIPLAPAELVPSLGHRRLYGKLEDLEAQRAGGLLDQALRAAGRIYNGRHEAEPLVAIELFQARVDLERFRAGAPLARKLVRRVVVAGEGA